MHWSRTHHSTDREPRDEHGKLRRDFGFRRPEIDVVRRNPGLEEVDGYLAHHLHPRASLSKQQPNDAPQPDQDIAADNEEGEPQFDRERELAPFALLVACHAGTMPASSRAEKRDGDKMRGC